MGYRVSRELYSPDDEVSKMILAVVSAHYSKKTFVLEDLLTFHNYGWKICYTGKKSKRLHLLNAEYLGECNEENPQEET
jgi:hypothetical protein